MTPKTPPCSDAPRHKWAWYKNVTRRRESHTSIQLTVVSLYKCVHCGATKQGPKDPNH